MQYKSFLHKSNKLGAGGAVSTNKRKKTGNNMKLLIVESPAKIKTISKFLGSTFKIMSTFGHIKDLPAKKVGITRHENGSIDLEYVVIENKEDVISSICKQASNCDEVYLASDPDREGEIISWHIGQEIEKVFKEKENIFRISFNEITETAINAAIEKKKTINMDVVNAQQARRILDRWVGYEVSPILWKKIAKGLSAGRVQSVALLLVCTRDEEIAAFKPEESWSIHVLFTVGETGLQAELAKIKKKTFDLTSKEEADKVLDAVKKETYSVTQITEKKRAKNPLPPFETSTLQQDAYNKLGFSVDKTMSVAQKLYEGVPLLDKNQPEALITYMRTDSLRISDTALKAARSFIKSEYGDEFCPKSANVYGKGAQDAHEAVRPIDVKLTPQKIGKFLKPEQAKLYDLIWKRFVASQMTAAEFFQRQVLIDGGPYTFKATGSTLVFEGFLKVYLEEDEESDQAVKIPKEIAEKLELPIKNANGKQHFTQPPPRYTEATLVKELKKQGIGRPSTYATILTTIEKRSYVERDTSKRFQPTELGKAVSSMLAKNLPDIINVTFTAKMEEDLDKIAQGEVDRDNVLNDFYTEFKKDLVAFGGSQTSQKSVETNLTCPDCEKPLVVRFGKAGQFAGCSDYPTCKFTSNVARNEDGSFALVKTEDAVGEESSTLVCPQCGKHLVKKMGKFGPFWSCPGYPECKYIHQDTLKMPCPQCNSALTKRRWRGGSFWGCAKYPDCKFAIFGQVNESPCPLCSSSYLLVTKDKEGNEKHACPNKECSYKVTIS